jgi:SulP family sulfate permease
MRDRRLSELWTRRPDRGTLAHEAVVGLPAAIGSVPDGMANALLAGINPVFGLYASMAGRIVGSLSSSTQLAIVTTTGASALAAGSALAGVSGSARGESVVLLTILAGGFMIAASFLRLGRYVRFVSNSVMVGFISGVAANILLGQIPDLTGAPAEGSTAIQKALSVVLHPGKIDPPTLLLGLIALSLITVASRTRLRSLGALLALAIPSAIVALGWVEGVATVADEGAIPTGLPLPTLPHLSAFSLDLVVGAAAVAVIVLVQGAGVSETVPNPDGTRADTNRDFAAQGWANVAAGMLSGQPVGTSVGQTALNVSADARSRWSGAWSGVWLALILVAFSGLVGEVATTTLAAVLIFAAIGAIRPDVIALTLRTGATSQIALITTFVATLLLPVAVAVGIGVAMSLMLQANREALDLTVVELRPHGNGEIEVGPAPRALEPRSVTMLDVYGSLLFAGARTLEVRLPDPAGAGRCAVVLRLRGRTALSSTSVQVLIRYAHRLSSEGGRLFLSGVEGELASRLERIGGLERIGSVEMVRASNVLGESSRTAYRAARDWIDEEAHG